MECTVSFERDVKLVYQSLLDEHAGNATMALWDLSHRFVLINRGYSPGFARTAAIVPAAPVKPDVPPNPITDDWLTTAREG
jgi:hypothetical protein